MKRFARTLILGIGFTSLGALGAATTVAIASGGPGFGPGFGAHMQIPALMQELELDDAQKATAKQIRQDIQDLMGAQQGDRSETWQRVTDALEGDSPDAEALHALLDERVAARAETFHTVLDELLEFYGVLDEDQRQLLLDRMGEARERRQRMKAAWEGEE